MNRPSLTLWSGCIISTPVYNFKGPGRLSLLFLVRSYYTNTSIPGAVYMYRPTYSAGHIIISLMYQL